MVEKIILHLSINLGFLTQNEICLADVLILGKSHLRTFVLFSFLPSYSSLNVTYRKIPKISPASFQRPFLRGLFLDGLIFVGAYVRREVCVSKSIGLAYSWKEIYRLWFVLLCIWGQFPSTSPQGAYIWRGDLTEGFLRYEFGGLIHGGAYFRNFTVVSAWDSNMAAYQQFQKRIY